MEEPLAWVKAVQAILVGHEERLFWLGFFCFVLLFVAFVVFCCVLLLFDPAARFVIQKQERTSRQYTGQWQPWWQ